MNTSSIAIPDRIWRELKLLFLIESYRIHLSVQGIIHSGSDIDPAVSVICSLEITISFNQFL